MNVMLVNGSPHKEGNTYLALTQIAETLKEEGVYPEIFWIGRAPISGCQGCRACRRPGHSGHCVIDDVVNEFLRLSPSFDGFISGTPVHWAGASGALTSFMDRAFYADPEQFYLKPAAAVCVARRSGATATWDQLNKYFGLVQMPIVTSQYWNLAHGGTPGEATQDAEGMQTMRTLARNMAFLLKCKQVALENGVPLPQREPHAFTNFIR